MSHRKITQREAQRFRKRVAELEQAINTQRSRWGQQYPGGEQIVSSKYEQNSAVPVAIRTARALKHGVVVIADDDGLLHFMALPLPKVQ